MSVGHALYGNDVEGLVRRQEILFGKWEEERRVDAEKGRETNEFKWEGEMVRGERGAGVVTREWQGDCGEVGGGAGGEDRGAEVRCVHGNEDGVRVAGDTLFGEVGVGGVLERGLCWMLCVVLCLNVLECCECVGKCWC
jgi:hypothetical protein